MRPIRINLLVMLLVLLSGAVAWFISVGYILIQTDRNARNLTHTAAESAQHQLELQLLRKGHHQVSAGDFPDFHLWQRSGQNSGLCAHYRSLDETVERSLCVDENNAQPGPSWFEALYRSLFQPEQSVSLAVGYKGTRHGTVTVAPGYQVELARAWKQVVNLSSLSLITVLILCLCLYVAMRVLLRPLESINKTLLEMHQGNLTASVPESNVKEWQATGSTINELASQLEQTLDERKRLSLKLLSLQEQERRHLCRELHDELGQSLSGLRAVAHMLQAESKGHSPGIESGAEQVSKITRHMMELVKGVLLRLRPADLDELGLSESLKELVTQWNNKHHQIHCDLTIEGSDADINHSVAVNLLRVVQECLTNISKHSGASRARIHLSFPTQKSSIALHIEDNGRKGKHCFEDEPGIGLLGIHERISALNGELRLDTTAEGGLAVNMHIPVLSGYDHEHH